MDLTKRTKFSLTYMPGDAGISFECEGNAIDQMQMLISVMDANDHAKSIIFSVMQYWKENKQNSIIRPILIDPRK